MSDDEFMERRFKGDPDYGLLIDIKGYRFGVNRVQWRIEPIAHTASVNIEDPEQLIEIFEKVIEALKTP